jgi:mono/diheme cytochrome c family protein
MAFCFAAGTTNAEENKDRAAGEKMFALKVRPLLAEKCLACHGKNAEKIESGLNLTTRAGMLKGGEVSEQVLVPGDAAKSLLYVAVTWEDPSCEMPPKENDRLTKEQTWWVRDWINAGAPWPSDEEIARIIAAEAKNQKDLIAVKTCLQTIVNFLVISVVSYSLDRVR